MLVQIERQLLSLEALTGHDAAMAAVSAAELLVGVALADEQRRAPRAARVEALLASVPIEPYELDVARSHAALLAHARRTGRPRPAHDLIIAATAHARGYDVLTADATGFADLPGISVASL